MNEQLSKTVEYRAVSSGSVKLNEPNNPQWNQSISRNPLLSFPTLSNNPPKIHSLNTFSHTFVLKLKTAKSKNHQTFSISINTSYTILINASSTIPQPSIIVFLRVFLKWVSRLRHLPSVCPHPWSFCGALY